MEPKVGERERTMPRREENGEAGKPPENPQADAADGGFVMERKGRIEDLDRAFDIEYWQRQGPDAIQAAAQELVEVDHRQFGEDVNALRVQRTVEHYGRLPG